MLNYLLFFFFFFATDIMAVSWNSTVCMCVFSEREKPLISEKEKSISTVLVPLLKSNELARSVG